MTTLLLRVVLALAILALCGCNSSYPGITPVAPTLTPTLVSIAVSATLYCNDLQHVRLQANGRYSDGAWQSLTNVVAFQSSDPSIATVSEPGILTVGYEGTIAKTVIVTATYQDKAGSLNLTWPPDCSPQ